MTADDVRGELAAALAANGYRPATHAGILDALLPVVDEIAGKRAAEVEAKVQRVEVLAKEYAERSDTVPDGFWKRHLWIVSLRLRAALDAEAGS